jgi:hypothetical protein
MSSCPRQKGCKGYRSEVDFPYYSVLGRCVGVVDLDFGRHLPSVEDFARAIDQQTDLLARPTEVSVQKADGWVWAFLALLPYIRTLRIARDVCWDRYLYRADRMDMSPQNGLEAFDGGTT